LLFACTTQIHSQRALSGHVTDTTNTPIALVNVFLTKGEGTSIIKYTYTDDAGYYRLEFDHGGEYILNVNGLSYRKYSTRIKIDSLATTATISKEITLTQDSQHLDEVVVNANLPILVKKDTVVIRVASFINGSEDVAEDILKKLPGIEVASDGTVKVQGRNVEKVMIEGDDLFEKGYKLLTKNLNAGVIDKVEILQHFSDNPLLKNIEDSEDVALNIILKEEVKSTFFGTIELGYGIKNTYENKLNIISIKKKSKYYVFGNMNTVGNDATGDIFQLVYPDYLTGNAYIGDGISASKIMGMTINQPSIESSRFNFNEAELASINGVFNPSEKLKIKGLFYFTTDENKYFRTQNEFFKVGDVSFLNSESYALYKASKMASSKIQAHFKIDQNHQIEYVGKLNLARFLYKGKVDFNTTAINPSLTDDTKNTDHRITYTGKINMKSAYQLTSRYVYDHKPQNYFFDDFIYQDLFPENDSIQSIAAKSHIKTSFVGFESTLFSKGARSNLEIRTGYSWQKSELISSLRLNAPMAQMDAGTAYQNDFKFELGDVYVKSNYRQYFGSVSLGLSLDAHQYFATDVKYQSVNDAPFNLIPGLGFSWQINKDNKFIVSYKYGLKNTNLEDIYDGYILSNYRFFQKGLGSFQQFRGNFFLASYFLGDWQDSFLLNGTMIYNKDNAYLGSNTVIRQNYVQSTPILLMGKEFFSMNLSVDRFIEALSTNLKLKVNYTDNYYQNVVNSSSLRDITFRTYDYGLEIRSIFPNAINFHLGHTLTVAEVASPEKNRNQSYVSFMDVDVKASEKLLFQLKNERYSYGKSGSSSTFYFSDFRAKYQVKPNKMALKLDVVNLWNTKNIGTLDISDTGYLQSSYRLLPRYVLLAMTYRF
jgi:hypothetical protein